MLTIEVWSKRAAKTGVGTAGKFLQETRPFLSSEKLAPYTAAILQNLDQGKLYPSQAINALYEALSKYESKKRIAQATRANKVQNFTVSIFGEPTFVYPDGILIASYRCERGDDAQAWADRYLSEHAPVNSYATITSRTEATKLKIDRLGAMARINRKKARAATVPTVRVSADRLSFGVGGQYNKPQYFSRG